MRMPWLVLSFVLAPFASADAGVVVVDPANGPGTDFTSLASAIAAPSSAMIESVLPVTTKLPS